MTKRSEVECMLYDMKEKIKDEFRKTDEFKTVRKEVTALLDREVAEIGTTLDDTCPCKKKERCSDFGHFFFVG